jgi:PPM family protein phosphatase
MFETREFKYIPPTVTASVTTDAGCVRESNEDRGRHVSPNDLKTQTRRGTLTIVADGMGGHASGEIASEMAIELISEFYYADQTSDAPDALLNAIRLANSEIFKTSISDEKFYGMGTTVIALVVLDKIAYAAHVGDSRLYRLRGGEMKQMTMDHSQVMEMFRQGIISWEETKNHDDKNIILRAVGTQKEVEVEISAPFSVEPNDEFLLCSDGLCDMLADEEIFEIWTQVNDVHEAGERLVQRAKDNGGHDNITVALLRVPAANETLVSRNVPATRETGALKS